MVAATQQKTDTYQFTDRNFNTLREIVSEQTGISLSDHKRDLVYGRLTRRLRALGLSGFDAYCDLLQNNPGEEMEHFTNAITTNLTSFFRERHHFDYLSQELIPDLLQQNRLQNLRVWSAGCSTGEEPYSIAITLRESIPNIDNYDVRILATDLDTNVVKQASSGIYAASRVEGLPKEQLRRWFLKGKGDNAGSVRVNKELCDMITFRQLNLMNAWPMQGKFDIIFCRNVVIYFDKPTQAVLFDRFANQIQDNSHLFIGHSENLNKVTDRFSLIGKTIYRKIR
ncbi:MAG TPA: protein-glutamate O-methyltransferase CheR [Chromatiales bacterium]|nr:protein-glutamate O-methyltransferase CheR [Thiotrichales bacterium]HIP67606.1 protein-glutamate O-methyltransferase CheR [Chromatiales bacterium]